ncbi:L-asparaginase precursor [Poronia punctata]|nr:L-asparaginase precursor [Poronia punctata]
MSPPTAVKVRPRIIIHGGAGNIQPSAMSADEYEKHRKSLLSIITSTDAYMRTPKNKPTEKNPGPRYPSALEIATYAVVQLENDPLYNSGRGAVFTRDGINELEASVMVSRGFAKRGLGVTGLRAVKNPVLLAKAMLEHGEQDLLLPSTLANLDRDVPSAQGHTLIHGETAETLARQYGLEMVDQSYYFTQKRWDEHVRGLEKKNAGSSWRSDEYIPQGTCGAAALDQDGVVCAATSTGGITNKLTGRIGDTPVVGAGFWAEEWVETGKGSQSAKAPWESLVDYIRLPGPVVELSSNLGAFLADCLPTPFMYSPIASRQGWWSGDAEVEITRSTALSGTGNGDSFLRVAAARSAVAIARWARLPASDAVSQIAGRGGELERSAGPRWGKTGEGEGGMIGVDCAIARDRSGTVVYARSEVIQAHNCAGMFRAWIKDDGSPSVSIWREEEDIPVGRIS